MASRPAGRRRRSVFPDRPRKFFLPGPVRPTGPADRTTATRGGPECAETLPLAGANGPERPPSGIRRPNPRRTLRGRSGGTFIDAQNGLASHRLPFSFSNRKRASWPTLARIRAKSRSPGTSSKSCAGHRRIRRSPGAWGKGRVRAGRRPSGSASRRRLQFQVEAEGRGAGVHRQPPRKAPLEWTATVVPLMVRRALGSETEPRKTLPRWPRSSPSWGKSR